MSCAALADQCEKARAPATIAQAVVRCEAIASRIARRGGGAFAITAGGRRRLDERIGSRSGRGLELARLRRQPDAESWLHNAAGWESIGYRYEEAYAPVARRRGSRRYRRPGEHRPLGSATGELAAFVRSPNRCTPCRSSMRSTRWPGASALTRRTAPTRKADHGQPLHLTAREQDVLALLTRGDVRTARSRSCSSSARRRPASTCRTSCKARRDEPRRSGRALFTAGTIGRRRPPRLRPMALGSQLDALHPRRTARALVPLADEWADYGDTEGLIADPVVARFHDDGLYAMRVPRALWRCRARPRAVPRGTRERVLRRCIGGLGAHGLVSFDRYRGRVPVRRSDRGNVGRRKAAGDCRTGHAPCHRNNTD